MKLPSPEFYYTSSTCEQAHYLQRRAARDAHKHTFLDIVNIEMGLAGCIFEITTIRFSPQMHTSKTRMFPMELYNKRWMQKLAWGPEDS